MKKNPSTEQILFSTNCQKVLSFLIQNPDREYFDREISTLTGVSRAGANFALRDLAGAGLVVREQKGRMNFYRADADLPLIRYMKITQNIAALVPLVEKIKPFSVKIMLYGSAALGENNSESDLDVHVITRDPDEVEKKVFKDAHRKKIQHLVHTPDEYVKLKKNNPTFYREIEKGIILWEGK